MRAVPRGTSVDATSLAWYPRPVPLRSLGARMSWGESPEAADSAVNTSPGSKPALVFAVVNQKGGVGKTTTAVNLAASLAASERSTLLIDLDPQANASSAFGISAPELQVYDLLNGDCTALEAAQPTELSHLHVIPSGEDLSGAEIELVAAEERHARLRAGIEPILGLYDYILIDCPPSLGILTLNALVASTSVLIPLQGEYYALEGLARLQRTIERIRSAFHPGLTIEGIVLTMFDRRANLSRQVEEDVRAHFGERVFASTIPRNVRLSEAPSHGKPILLYDIQSRGALAYLELAREVLERHARPQRKPPQLPIPKPDSAVSGEESGW
jgi:chromosome partitioning protein